MIILATGLILVACVLLVPAVFLLSTHPPQARPWGIAAGVLIGLAWGIITLHLFATLLVQDATRIVDLVGSAGVTVLCLAGTWTLALLPDQVPPPWHPAAVFGIALLLDSLGAGLVGLWGLTLFGRALGGAYRRSHGRAGSTLGRT